MLAACGGNPEKSAEGEETVETRLPEEENIVTVQTLELADFHHELISNGKLTARHYADLRFAASEPVARIYVKNGERVTKGQKLAELSMFRLDNKVAQSAVALENAKLELQDVLIGQGYKLADTASVPAATMKLAKVKSGYEQALAQHELDVYEREHAVLTAPFDGVVANLFAKEYNVPSDTEAFCTVIDPASLEASFSVLESELPLIRVGDKTEIVPFAGSGQSVAGRISEINPLVDENGMVQVKTSVERSRDLYEGMNVRVKIQRSLGKQLVIPKSAVVLRSGRQVVFTLKDGKAQWIYVKTGLENTDSYTVVEGLAEKDVVITSGNVNLADQVPVKVREE